MKHIVSMSEYLKKMSLLLYFVNTVNPKLIIFWVFVARVQYLFVFSPYKILHAIIIIIYFLKEILDIAT